MNHRARKGTTGTIHGRLEFQERCASETGIGVRALLIILDMDKKLEQQFNDYYYSNYAYITSQADTKEIVKSIANHFYNLALADVRGEVEKTVRNKSMILRIIDNLTK